MYVSLQTWEAKGDGSTSHMVISGSRPARFSPSRVYVIHSHSTINNTHMATELARIVGITVRREVVIE
jgi:hypothetical protein